jgi:hypothetical protein
LAASRLSSGKQPRTPQAKKRCAAEIFKIRAQLAWEASEGRRESAEGVSIALERMGEALREGCRGCLSAITKAIIAPIIGLFGRRQGGRRRPCGPGRLLLDREAVASAARNPRIYGESSLAAARPPIVEGKGDVGPSGMGWRRPEKPDRHCHRRIVAPFGLEATPQVVVGLRVLPRGALAFGFGERGRPVGTGRHACQWRSGLRHDIPLYAEAPAALRLMCAWRRSTGGSHPPTPGSLGKLIPGKLPSGIVQEKPSVTS